MPSQFAKRKAKTIVPEVPVTEPVGDTPEAELTHMAYDVFLDESDNAYKIVTIRYNPLTGDVVIDEIIPIGRHIGLIHANQKLALSTLKKY